MNYKELIHAGINVDEFTERLLNNTEIICVILNKFVSDTNFLQLKEDFKLGDMKSAESHSHTLKGVCGNLSLVKLHELLTQQVKHIRAGEFKEAQAMMRSIGKAYDTAIRHVKRWLAENDR